MKGPKHLPHHPREAAEFILSVVGAANIPTLLTYTADIPWREINACIRALRIERGEAEFYNSDDGLAPAAGASSSADA